MTPQVIKFLKKRGLKYRVVSCCTEIYDLVNSHRRSQNNIEGDIIEGIILSGGPLRLIQKVDLELLQHNLMVLLRFPNIPILGICFGCQVMALAYGGKLDTMGKEFTGKCFVNLKHRRGLFRGFKEKMIQVFASHHDYIKEAPPGFKVTVTSDYCGQGPPGNLDIPRNMIQGIEHPKLKRWGVQFHPEGLEESREIILSNFIRICDAHTKPVHSPKN